MRRTIAAPVGRPAALTTAPMTLRVHDSGFGTCRPNVTHRCRSFEKYCCVLSIHTNGGRHTAARSTHAPWARPAAAQRHRRLRLRLGHSSPTHQRQSCDEGAEIHWGARKRGRTIRTDECAQLATPREVARCTLWRRGAAGPCPARPTEARSCRCGRAGRVQVK
jgi:hypothetical protein